MPPPVKSAYVGGWNENTKRKLEQVTIPDKVKCVNCKKVRMQSMFSKRQLEYLRHGIITQGARAVNGTGIAKCRTCVGGQTVELKCCICDKIKGLEDFAKAQRQLHDTARCLNCVQFITDTELVDEQKLIPESELTTQDTALTRSQFDDESLAATTNRLNLNSPYARSGFSVLEEEDDDLSIGGGVWVESESGNDENSLSKGKSRMYTSFDASSTAHRRVTDSQSGGYDSFRGNGNGQVYALKYQSAAAQVPNVRTGNTLPRLPLPKKKASNFAKVPGRRVPANEAPSMRVPESTAEAHHSDDDDSDNGIEEFL
ncbi:uncharacterized protein ASPGLDRAFT_51475 [Aspergillus glaucus CBS 516.65]|uniref:Stc1 domain-containing protein n=1 Tax=Aspergillus glaucus CBS 516.65 TaxID=1160497 RepID=A0A1L9V9L1_ASPGL|nr:hypothetical protein ASPGLDRAFT_51475 [Aspergillus glaucus CBS 516.65]OJJ80614.1 hypothetical protein ASPGLDRAFT_51475 [Aspergillus glaucus CBS 516.65]